VIQRSKIGKPADKLLGKEIEILKSLKEWRLFDLFRGAEGTRYFFTFSSFWFFIFGRRPKLKLQMKKQIVN